MAFTYSPIASVTVGAGGASSITFNDIPQNYTDLVLKWSGRNTVTDVLTLITFNGSTASYSGKRLYGSGSTVVSNAGGTTNMNPPSIVASSYTTNTFGNSEIYIPNYVGSNNKSISIDGVTENNATEAYAGLYAGLWSNTTAITSISLVANGGNFAQYSTAYLYGIRATEY